MRVLLDHGADIHAVDKWVGVVVLDGRVRGVHHVLYKLDIHVVWLWIVVTWWCTCVAFCVLLALPYPSPSSHLLALFLSCSP